MKRVSVACGLVCLVFGLAGDAYAAKVKKRTIEQLVLEGIPEVPDAYFEKVKSFNDYRSSSFRGWVPGDKGMLISTRFAETSQVHWVKTDGGARHQLTFFDEPVGSVSVSPNKDTFGFIYGKDQGGSEAYQLYYFDLKTKETRLLTDGKARHGSALWDNDGKNFVYYSTKRNGKDWDIYIQDIKKPGSEQLLLEGKGAWIPIDWSRDNQKLLILEFVSSTESKYYVFDIKTKKVTEFNPMKEEVAYGAAEFSRKGDGIYYISDENSEFKRLRFANLDGSGKKIISEDVNWDVEEFVQSPKGRYIAFTANENGVAKLHLFKAFSGRNLRIRGGLPLAQAYGLDFSPDEDKLAVTLNGPRTPGDVYTISIPNGNVYQWTFSEVGSLNPETFIEPEVIEFESFDKKKISSIYYKPNSKDKGKFPVIISIHGGPESQSQPYFSPKTQYYVENLGFAVLLPNVRGSSGYGKSFLKLDNGFQREDSVKDIGALLDWIKANPELDENRVIVTGGSYGGYMVLASMIHFRDRLMGGVDVVGISNFLTFLENTKDYRRDLRRVEYGDERDPKMKKYLAEISPTRNAHKINKPLLIVQGKNDPRVPLGEAEQMVKAIRKNNGQVWYMLGLNEGHGFSKKKNQDYYTAVQLFFLDSLLSGKEI